MRRSTMRINQKNTYERVKAHLFQTHWDTFRENVSCLRLSKIINAYELVSETHWKRVHVHPDGIIPYFCVTIQKTFVFE